MQYDSTGLDLLVLLLLAILLDDGCYKASTTAVILPLRQLCI